MKFAILAAGGIARKMAEAVTGIEKAGTVRIQKYAVASRDLSRAEELRKRMAPMRNLRRIRRWSLSMWRHPIPTTTSMRSSAWSMESMCWWKRRLR